MNVTTQQKRFATLAKQLKNNIPLNSKQRQYLAECFEKLSVGADANLALGLSRAKGESLTKELSRQRQALILHWVSNAILPTNEAGLGLLVEEAIDAVVAMMNGQWTNPRTQEIFHYKDKYGRTQSPFGCIYTRKTIQKLWDSKQKKYLKSINQTSTSEDSPY